MSHSNYFPTIERVGRSLVAATAWHKSFQVQKCISEPPSQVPVHTLPALAAHWASAAVQGEEESRTLTCRTCRTDVHNVAVGHKHAVKLLFGFGVACKIDSSVGKKKKKSSVVQTMLN